MSETFPGAEALTSYLRTGSREDRTLYRSFGDADRAAYRALVAAVFERAVDRYFGEDLPADRIDRLIVRIAERNPQYAGAVQRVLRSLIEGEDRLRDMTPRQMLTAQHLVIHAVGKRHPDFHDSAEEVVAEAVSVLRGTAPVRRGEPVESPEPPAFALPDNYEAQLDEAKEFLQYIPASPDLEAAQKILDAAPSREDIEALQQQAAEAQSLIASIESEAFEGSSPDGSVVVAIDAAGRVRRLEFEAFAARLNHRDLGEAVRSAWDAAERDRDAANAGLIDRGQALGGHAWPGLDGFGAEREKRDAEMLRQIVEFVSGRDDERFEHTSESGLCKAVVNQGGRLTNLQFLRTNVLRSADRETVAAEVRAAIVAAQTKAASEVGSNVDQLRDEPT